MNTNLLDENYKFSIPENSTSFKIDVGLAGEAPNSALWLGNDPNVFVIGIEPLEYHWKMLQNYDTANSKRCYPSNFKIIQLEQNIVSFNRKKICDIGKRFIGLKYAIDNIEGIVIRKFYSMDKTDGGSGSSSLLKPTLFHPQRVEEEVEVNCVSLQTILNHISWDKFSFIEHLKTDCEGYDLTVIKSLGKYLNKVLFISSEYLSQECFWENQGKKTDLIEYMSNKGFDIISCHSGEIHFINSELSKIVDMSKVNCVTLGL
tara:strand:- start:2711 stop:3490 length:780 start_codon:yes stop_codon:yes gene_type:complete